MLSERLAHHIELDRAIYHTQHDTRSGIDVSQFLSCRFMYAVDGRRPLDALLTPPQVP